MALLSSKMIIVLICTSAIPMLWGYRRRPRARLRLFAAHCWLMYTAAFDDALADRLLPAVPALILAAALSAALVPALLWAYRRDQVRRREPAAPSGSAPSGRAAALPKP